MDSLYDAHWRELNMEAKEINDDQKIFPVTRQNVARGADEIA